MYDIKKQIQGTAPGVEEIKGDRKITSTNKLYFYDTGLYIYSSTDGQLDIVADTLINLGGLTAIGTYASPMTLTTAITQMLMLGGDALTDLASGVHRCIWARAKVSKDQTGNSIMGIEAQCRVNGAASAAATLGAGQFTGIWAYWEQSGTTALNTGALASGASCTVEGAATLTIDSGAILAGVVIDSSVNGSATNNGTFDAIYIKKAASALDWKYGIEFTDCVSDAILKVADDGTVCHDTDTGSGTDLQFSDFTGYITVVVGSATRYIPLLTSKPSDLS